MREEAQVGNLSVYMLHGKQAIFEFSMTVNHCIPCRIEEFDNFAIVHQSIFSLVLFEQFRKLVNESVVIEINSFLLGLLVSHSYLPQRQWLIQFWSSA